MTPASGAAARASVNAAQTHTAAIVLDGVGKTFRRGKIETRALERIDLSVEDGEFIAIVGPSGCGKSTLLRLIAGLTPSTAGSIDLQGVRVEGPQTALGMVFQSAVLLEWRNVLANVLLLLEMRGFDPAPHRERAFALLSPVGLGEFTDRYPRALSGGMRHRAAIVRALIHDPRMLLM